MNTLHDVGTGFYIMPQDLINAVRGDPADPWAGFTAATAYARNGFRVLPCQPGGRKPLSYGSFRHGANSSTADLEQVRDCWVAEPTANVGVAPAGDHIILDVDPRNGGSLESAEALGMPIHGYRERSGGGGWHIPMLMPMGYTATKSTTLAPGIEIKAQGSYAVSPHSWVQDGGRYMPEPGREVWAWPVIRATWEYLPRITVFDTSATYELGAITGVHRREARRVIGRLEKDRFGVGIRRILAGDWQWRYPTASERDAGIALMATVFTDVAEVVAAIILSISDLSRKPDPALYLNLTVSAAFTERQRRTKEAISVSSADLRAQLELWRPENGSPSVQPLAPTVIYGTSSSNGQEKARRINCLYALLTGLDINDGSGFVRVPVMALADAMNVNRKTVQRDIAELESAGLLVTEVRQSSVAQRERWVRFTPEIPEIAA